ncbi:helix-turn-helix domain-containing protein [Streptomyces javensis]|uniref:Helix-turn-helix domain-containing protein n=1 Tax=Streptomyces javensis TaxID=114698 RepID=A0ABS0R827_9ACTN|nr:helix-turn-helix transcriptional regulator [Streptomyces javensis]MBI0313566.1 helix-turn-helix domain-containing protein [Streptomyces javensis]
MGAASADAPKGLPHEGTLALASPAGRQLAAELRRVKQTSGLSFARLESRTHYSKASLERYVNGKLFPGRDAVEDIAQACGADPGPLLEFWDEALNVALKAAMEAREATPPPAPETATDAESPIPADESTHRPHGPFRNRRNLVLLAGLGMVIALSAVVLVFPWSGRTAAPKPPTSGCRDYYVDIHAYTTGKVCWKSASATVNGYVENPDSAGKATAQLCVSNHPDVCSQIIDLASAAPGKGARYHRTVHLAAGHGVWVRACAKGLCTQWD